MSSAIIDGVDRRTRLVGRNRLELLLFRLAGAQRFGINVFKVREVIQCPPLTRIPEAHPVVRGIARLRGVTIPVMDLAQAIGAQRLPESVSPYIIVSEFNRHVQGFLVGGVDRIVNLNWEAIRPPPRGSGAGSFVTAVTEIDGKLVEVIDVEKVLADVLGVNLTVSDAVLETGIGDRSAHILVVDDSAVARGQITATLEQLGVTHEVACDGEDALMLLSAMLDAGRSPVEHFDALISDIEMPRMDGYTLTKAIKSHDQLKALPVILHTSLSGIFNKAMVERVGADEFVPKFDANALAEVVQQRLGGQTHRATG